jgi:hypothetical protein
MRYSPGVSRQNTRPASLSQCASGEIVSALRPAVRYIPPSAASSPLPPCTNRSSDWAPALPMPTRADKGANCGSWVRRAGCLGPALWLVFCLRIGQLLILRTRGSRTRRARRRGRHGHPGGGRGGRDRQADSVRSCSAALACRAIWTVTRGRSRESATGFWVTTAPSCVAEVGRAATGRPSPCRHPGSGSTDVWRAIGPTGPQAGAGAGRGL